LIEAASKLDPAQFQVRIAGAGDLTEELKSYAAQVAPQTVQFLGKLSKEDLEAEYQNADCFVLPAIVDSKGDTEGLGVVLIEAAEYGLPIVASAVGGIGDVVIDGQTGLLVPQKDAEALVCAFERLRTESGLRERLVMGALAHIRENFGWQGIVERQMAVLREI
jgi:glycosyltransferase involved in cell wall biosynthesis